MAINTFMIDFCLVGWREKKNENKTDIAALSINEKESEKKPEL